MKKYVKVVIPRKVDEFLNLSSLVLAKHTADGTASLLSGLNMADMAAKHTLATTRHSEAQQLARDREMATQQRNNALGLSPTMQSYNEGAVLYYATSIRNHLLGQFRQNEQTLGLWGFVVNISAKGNVSVVVPRSPAKLMELAKRILAKHTADDEDSLLSEFDMADFADKVEYAGEQHTLSDARFKEMKHAYRSRNLALGFDRRQKSTMSFTLLYYVTSVRDVLLGNFRENEHELGLWGFNVVSSSPPAPEPPVLTAAVQGMVVNQSTAQPLSGVQVVFASSKGNAVFVTNALGSYGGEVEIGGTELVMVEIAHAGYLPMNEAHPLSPDLSHTLDFALIPVVTP